MRVKHQAHQSYTQPQHAAIPAASNIQPVALNELPGHPTSQALRQSAVLDVQRNQGNRFLAQAMAAHSAKPQPRVVMRRPDVRSRGLVSAEVREIRQLVQEFRENIPRLERRRSITTEEAEIWQGRAERMAAQTEQLAQTEQVSTQRARERWREGRRLLRAARFLRRLPRALRRVATRGRSTSGLRSIRNFQVTPAVIRISDHEAARINFIVRGRPRAIGCMILSDEQREGTSIREFLFRSPTPGYKSAIWDGTFVGSRNQPAEPGTYRVRVTVIDENGRMEEVFEQILVENPDGNTVLPRTNSGLALQSLRFDGRQATLTDQGGNAITVRAVSGLRPHHRLNPQRIDYTEAQYQWEPNRGPLPAGTYHIARNQVQRPDVGRRGQLRYATGGSAEAWGAMRIPLSPGTVGNRHSFFLHLDTTNDGTAGCIGVHPADEGKFNQIMSLIMWMTNDQLPVIVDY
jgi:hypothetical protein